MFLYIVPLIGVFGAAFVNPTNEKLTFAALGMAFLPQILIFVSLLLYFSNGCCGRFEKENLYLHIIYYRIF